MKIRVLIVDDEQEFVKALSERLTIRDYDVSTCLSGKEAVEKLKHYLYDVVILDVLMPGMSGRETCERIRENPETKDLRVVFLTVARFSEVGKDILSKMNVLDYITKPFDNEDLVKRIKRALES